MCSESHGTGAVAWAVQVFVSSFQTKVQTGLVCYTSGLTASPCRAFRLFASMEDAASNAQFHRLKSCKLCGGEKYKKVKIWYSVRAKREISYFFSGQTSFDSFPSFLLFSSLEPLSSPWVSNVLVHRLKKKGFMFVSAFLS